MKKKNYTSKKRNHEPKKTGRFGGLVRQLHQEKLVLVNFTQYVAFAEECERRDIALGIGDKYKDGIILYKK
jgi:hypothetical protein